MKSAGKARSNGLYRHIRTSKEIIRNLLNDYFKQKSRNHIPENRRWFLLFVLERACDIFGILQRTKFILGQIRYCSG